MILENSMKLFDVIKQWKTWNWCTLTVFYGEILMRNYYFNNEFSLKSVKYQGFLSQLRILEATRT